MTAEITITPLDSDDDVEAFARLNEKWISEYFTLTAEDERVLNHPRESIIAAGGDVLVAADDSGSIVGVIAILHYAPGVYELAKMTVSEAARGQGVGRQLIGAAIAWAKEHEGQLVFLGTNSRLVPAIRLYEEAGFQRTTIDDLGLTDYYARADILMKLELAHN